MLCWSVLIVPGYIAAARNFALPIRDLGFVLSSYVITLLRLLSPGLSLVALVVICVGVLFVFHLERTVLIVHVQILLAQLDGSFVFCLCLLALV